MSCSSSQRVSEEKERRNTSPRLAPAQGRDQHQHTPMSSIPPSRQPEGNAQAPSSSPSHVRTSLLAWWSSMLVVLPRSRELALEELVTQWLSRSWGIRAASWDTEEKLRQLTWHHDPKLLGVPMRHKGEERQEQGICRQACRLVLGSLSPHGLISIP